MFLFYYLLRDPGGPPLTDLPEEILIETFLELPIKSLALLRSTCRRFKNLLQSQSFIQQQLKLSQYQFLLLQNGTERFNPFAVSLHSAWDELHHPVIESPEAPKGVSLKVSVIGSSYGVVCLGLSQVVFNRNQPIRHWFVIWNPFTRKYKEVPSVRSIYCVMGFGYSGIDNDYKIVRIVDDFYGNLSPCVYSLYGRRRPLWHRLNSSGLSGLEFGNDGVTMTEARRVVWRTYSETAKNHVILLFNTDEEVFKLLPSPTNLHQYALPPKPTEYVGRVALLSSLYDDIRRRTEVKLWLLDEEVSGWSVIYTVSLQGGCWCPATMWGEKIICMRGLEVDDVVDDVEGGESLMILSSHHIKTALTTTIGTHRVQDRHQICPYVKTFVNLD